MQNFIKKYRKTIISILLQIMILGIICALLYQPMMQILHDPQKLKTELQAYGLGGAMIMILIVAAQVVFAFLPGEIVEVLSGFIYGSIGGMIVCMLGMSLGTAIIFGLTRLLGHSYLYRMIDKEHLQEVSFLKDHQRLETILFIIFFIPGTPKDLITYFAPLLKISLGKFLVITMIARIPSIITSTISGNALGQKDYMLSLMVFAFTGIISLLGIYYYHKKIAKK